MLYSIESKYYYDITILTYLPTYMMYDDVRGIEICYHDITIFVGTYLFQSMDKKNKKLTQSVNLTLHSIKSKG